MDSQRAERKGIFNFLRGIMNTILRKKPVEVTVAEPVKPKIDDAYLREYLLKLWMADLNQRETDGKNRSPMIDAINKRLGVDMGSPYCIGGLLVRGVEVMCKNLNLKNPVKMTASTQSFWKAAPDKYKKLPGSNPRKADICIQRTRTDKARGHSYGLTVDQKDKELYQATIEYNTNAAGSRDGQGVYQLKRTQQGDSSKEYLGAVDVVRWILEANQL